ncbi:hypothetical protein JOM56_003859 [Amanita muscaria]
MPREVFVKEYMDVRHATFKSSTIETAWRKSGGWPINPTVFKDDDFAPSISASTSASHVPTSFPIHSSVEHDLYDNNLDNEEHESSDSESESDNNNTSQPSCSGPSGSPATPAARPMASETIQTSSALVLPSVLQPNPIPPDLFYAPITRSYTRQGNGSKDRLAQLEDDNTTLQSRISTLEAHCAMAHSEIQDLKRRVNARDGRSRKRPKLSVDARCLTSEEGLRLSQEQAALKAAQDQKKREAQEQRAARDAERQRQRMERDADEPFFGTLTAKSKPDLQDIAQALGISIEGSKKALLEHINNHFGTNPDLRNSPRDPDTKAFSTGHAVDPQRTITRISLTWALGCLVFPTRC